jgi:hypothetical protein
MGEERDIHSGIRAIGVPDYVWIPSKGRRGEEDGAYTIGSISRDGYQEISPKIITTVYQEI